MCLESENPLGKAKKELLHSQEKELSNNDECSQWIKSDVVVVVKRD